MNRPKTIPQELKNISSDKNSYPILSKTPENSSNEDVDFTPSDATDENVQSKTDTRKTFDEGKKFHSNGKRLDEYSEYAEC